MSSASELYAGDAGDAGAARDAGADEASGANAANAADAASGADGADGADKDAFVAKQWNVVEVSTRDAILVVGKRCTGRTTFSRQLVSAFTIMGLADPTTCSKRHAVAECKKAGPDPGNGIFRRETQTGMLMTWWKQRKLYTDGGTLNNLRIKANKNFSASSAAVVFIDDIESVADTPEECDFYCDLLANHAAYNVLVVASSVSIQGMSRYGRPTWTGVLKASLRLPQDKLEVCGTLFDATQGALCATIDACNFRGAVWYKVLCGHDQKCVADLTTLSFCHGCNRDICL